MEQKPCPQDASAFVQVAEIGRGSVGKVVLAHSEPLGADVAVKVVSVEEMGNEEQWQAAVQETKFQVRHPNVVPSLATFMSGSALWMVSPFAWGGSCRELLKTRYPTGFKDEQLIATILKDVLSGLEFLHSTCKAVHGDIKASNILIGVNGSAMISDFGLHTLLTTLGQRKSAAATFCGAPCWMAPEVWETGTHTQKADIWALGITALELAFGLPPRGRFPKAQVMKFTLTSPAPSVKFMRAMSNKPYSFPSSFGDFVECCLKRDPNKRALASDLLKHKFIKKYSREVSTVQERLVGTVLPPRERYKTAVGPSSPVCLERVADWDFAPSSDFVPKPILEMSFVDLMGAPFQGSTDSTVKTEGAADVQASSSSGSEAAVVEETTRRRRLRRTDSERALEHVGDSQPRLNRRRSDSVREAYSDDRDDEQRRRREEERQKKRAVQSARGSRASSPEQSPAAVQPPTSSHGSTHISMSSNGFVPVTPAQPQPHLNPTSFPVASSMSNSNAGTPPSATGTAPAPFTSVPYGYEPSMPPMMYPGGGVYAHPMPMYGMQMNPAMSYPQNPQQLSQTHLHQAFLHTQEPNSATASVESPPVERNHTSGPPSNDRKERQREKDSQNQKEHQSRGPEEKSTKDRSDSSSGAKGPVQNVVVLDAAGQPTVVRQSRIGRFVVDSPLSPNTVSLTGHPTSPPSISTMQPISEVVQSQTTRRFIMESPTPANSSIDAIGVMQETSLSEAPLEQWSYEDVATWLLSLGPVYRHYIGSFIESGVDGEFLCDMIGERESDALEMLGELQVLKKVHRLKILRSAQRLIRGRSVSFSRVSLDTLRTEELPLDEVQQSQSQKNVPLSSVLSSSSLGFSQSARISKDRQL